MVRGPEPPDLGSSDPGSSPGRGTALCSWARRFTLTVPLFDRVYKWVPANFLLMDAAYAMD